MEDFEILYIIFYLYIFSGFIYFSNTISKPDVMRAQIRRMIADPKSDALIENFAGQWLQIRNLSGVTPDPGSFPTFNDTLRLAMKRETERPQVRHLSPKGVCSSKNRLCSGEYKYSFPFFPSPFPSSVVGCGPVAFELWIHAVKPACVSIAGKPFPLSVVGCGPVAFGGGGFYLAKIVILCNIRFIV